MEMHGLRSSKLRMQIHHLRGDYSVYYSDICVIMLHTQCQDFSATADHCTLFRTTT